MAGAPSDFGQPPALRRHWLNRVRKARARGARTPFFLLAAEPIARSLGELAALDFGRPVRQWLSCKTQPAAPLLRWWRRQGRPIEVVSEFEFRAARSEGFDVENILVNGPAKQRWLPSVSAPGLRVNFDSPGELAALLPLARRHRWRVGVRLRTREEVDPEFPEFPTQFGFEARSAVAALRCLRRAGLAVETIHFHLRTNVAEPGSYRRAIDEVAEVCSLAPFSPRHLDIGGGLPPPFILNREGRRFDAGLTLDAYAAVLRCAWRRLPSVEELWLENGRFLSAGAGVLVVQVLDLKERRGLRQLICDGGRTLNALISTWEQHELVPLERRSGRRILTAVHGPTCMAFDLLARRPLASSLRVGDHLVWFEAGAYHLPWETRFSHGLAEVWWDEAGVPTRVRDAESFERFWSPWKAGSSDR